MNKKVLSVIMILVLTVVINNNVFATPSISTSDELKQTQDNKTELQTKVQQLDKQIDEVIKKVDGNKKDMNKIAQDMKNTEVKLEIAKNNSKVQDDLFKKRARAMYINGVDSYLQVILTSSSLNDFLSRIDMIAKVIGFDNELISKLKQERQAIENQKEALKTESNKLEALKTSNESTLSKLSQDIKTQKELLGKATEKEKQLMATQAEESAKAEMANNQFASNSIKSVALSRGELKSNSYSQVLNMEATAYSGDGITASGTATTRDSSSYSTIAVDPRVIPLGSRVYVEGYGYAIASDTGGAIKGNIIDVFFPSESEAQNWGRQSVKVYIIN